MPDRPGLPLAVLVIGLLSATSGAVDAFSFLHWEVFVANQTGNLVIMAMSIAGQPFPDALLGSALAFVGFVLGLALAWLLRDAGIAQRVRLVVAEAAVLLLTAIWWITELPGSRSEAIIAVLALSQGLQAVALVRVSGLGVRTVAITGALTDIAKFLAEGPRSLIWLAAAAPIGYAVAAMTSALGSGDDPWHGLVLATLATSVAILGYRRAMTYRLEIA